MPALRIVALVLGAAAIACSPAAERADSASPAPDTAVAGQPAVPSAPVSRVPAGPPEIFIDSVFVGNPVIVKGRARTFENTVQVRARDSRGELITEVFETSVGEMGNHNPFTAQVWLVRDPGAHVTLESFEYSANDGAVRSLTSKRVDIPAGRAEVTLHFNTRDCTSTTAFRREVPPTVALARLMVEALVAGPTAAETAKGATQPMPVGARVKSVVLRDSVLTVDFNERLQKVGGSCAVQAIRESITRTLTQLPAVKRVVITAGGSSALALQP